MIKKIIFIGITLYVLQGLIFIRDALFLENEHSEFARLMLPNSIVFVSLYIIVLIYLGIRKLKSS